jgi:hypothetical protein
MPEGVEHSPLVVVPVVQTTYFTFPDDCAALAFASCVPTVR